MADDLDRLSPLLLNTDIPEGWSRKRLEEIADISGGTTPRRSEESFWGGEVAWATPTDLTARPAGTLGIEHTEEGITDTALEETSVRVLPPGCVLMTSRATIGEVAVNSVPIATNQGFCNFVPSDGVDPRFLAYWLAGNKRRLERLAGGSTFLELSKRDARQVRIHLPPSSEQQKIAAILSSVDDAIAATRSVIDQAKRVKKGLLQTLMTRGIGHTRFKKTEIGEIPEEREVSRYDRIADVVRGGSPRPAGDPRFFDGDFIPWVTVAEITKDGWPYLDSTAECLTQAGAEKSRTLDAGTLLLVNSGATLGVPKILRIRACANDGVAAFLGLDDRVDKLFLYYHLSTLTDYMRQGLAPGVGQPNLNTTLIGGLPLPLPPLQEQREIARVCLSLDQTILAYGNAVRGFERLKHGLMQDLLTGRVRVHPD